MMPSAYNKSRIIFNIKIVLYHLLGWNEIHMVCRVSCNCIIGSVDGRFNVWKQTLKLCGDSRIMWVGSQIIVTFVSQKLQNDSHHLV